MNPVQQSHDAKMQRYQDIILSFGKNKGKSLLQLSQEPDGMKYLSWLAKTLKGDSALKELTPTRKAILYYCEKVTA